ncbi:MAG: hypothetical protein JWO51_2550 [Rhodospirillales bacterium]|nr:hypothetical protein [Rhodospirillales bacterium]
MTRLVVDATLRVRRHREKRAFVRVEVEVPTAEDATAIRRFAAEQRAGATSTAVPSGKATSIDALSLAVNGDARRAILIFAAAVGKAANPEAIARALRVATNFSDAVDYQARIAQGIGS